jgi:hypothetical protein
MHEEVPLEGIELFPKRFKKVKRWCASLVGVEAGK